MRPAWNAASRGGCCSHGGARCFLCLTGRNVRNHRLFQPCSPWGIVREFFSGGVSLGALSVFLVYNVVLASVQSVVAPQNRMLFSPGQYSCAYSLSRAPGARVGVSGFSLSRAPGARVGVSGFSLSCAPGAGRGVSGVLSLRPLPALFTCSILFSADGIVDFMGNRGQAGPFYRKGAVFVRVCGNFATDKTCKFPHTQ